MRRLTTVLLATCLVGTSAVPAIAQEPSPSVPATMYADDYLRLADELLEELHDSDVRYEFPEAGIALTFPGHWLTRESELGWGTLAEAQSLAEPLFCYLQAAQVARDDASASGAAEALTARYEGEGHPAVMRTRVLVPAGEAWRVDAEAESGPLTVYVVMSGRTLVALHCIAVDTERPADRWLSIAETLEFLPVGEPGAGQPPREGRPFQTTDFAVRFPDEWTVDEITPETHGWLYSKAGSDERIWSGVVYAHDAEFSCAVIDTTDYAHEHDLKSIDDAVAWELQAFSDDLDDPGSRIMFWLTDDPDGVTSSMVDLPAGPAGAIDVTDDDWWNMRTYVLSDGERWFYLHCDDTFEPPDDRWLSIAESFEFLPAEE